MGRFLVVLGTSRVPSPTHLGERVRGIFGMWGVVCLWVWVRVVKGGGGVVAWEIFGCFWCFGWGGYLSSGLGFVTMGREFLRGMG